MDLNERLTGAKKKARDSARKLVRGQGSGTMSGRAGARGPRVGLGARHADRPKEGASKAEKRAHGRHIAHRKAEGNKNVDDKLIQNKMMRGYVGRHKGMEKTKAFRFAKSIIQKRTGKNESVENIDEKLKLAKNSSTLIKQAKRDSAMGARSTVSPGSKSPGTAKHAANRVAMDKRERNAALKSDRGQDQAGGRGRVSSGVRNQIRKAAINRAQSKARKADGFTNKFNPVTHASPSRNARATRSRDLRREIDERLSAKRQKELDSTAWKVYGKNESVNEVTVKSMDQGKALKVYEKLKKGSKVTAEFGNAMSTTNKPIELVVSNPHRIVGKSKVGRIILKNPDGKGVKYTLFNRDGKISLAQGDMGTILKDLKIMKEEVEEAYKTPAEKKAERLAKIADGRDARERLVHLSHRDLEHMKRSKAAGRKANKKKTRTEAAHTPLFMRTLVRIDERLSAKQKKAREANRDTFPGDKKGGRRGITDRPIDEPQRSAVRTTPNMSKSQRRAFDRNVKGAQDDPLYRKNFARKMQKLRKEREDPGPMRGQRKLRSLRGESVLDERLEGEKKAAREKSRTRQGKWPAQDPLVKKSIERKQGAEWRRGIKAGKALRTMLKKNSKFQRSARRED